MPTLASLLRCIRQQQARGGNRQARGILHRQRNGKAVHASASLINWLAEMQLFSAV